MNRARNSTILWLPLIAPLIIAGCATEPLPDVSADQPVSTVDAMVDTIATAASAGAEPPAAPLTAEIVDVIDGGPGGVWVVKVDFPHGNGDGCYIDVFDKKTQKLLARDEVRDSPENSTSHAVQFRYRGTAQNLSIQVTEIGSGSVLADSEFR